MDLVLDTDWAEHWRQLVLTREAQVGGPRQDDFWERRAARFAFSMASQPDPLLEFLGRFLGPAKTLIDVGAGSGRHAFPLTARLDWVTAVEPSQAMREQIPDAANMTVIGAAWADADPAPADLVLCSHVLYVVAEPVPFIEKLEAHARERVFIALRDSPHPHPAELIAGPDRIREPRLRDCFLLLRQMGAAPEAWLHRVQVRHRFETLEAAVDDCRTRVGERWDEAAGRAWLEAHLRPGPDGSLVHEAGEIISGVLHWAPRS